MRFIIKYLCFSLLFVILSACNNGIDDKNTLNQNVNEHGLTNLKNLRSPEGETNKYTQISTGQYFTCSIDSVNRGWCWGLNESGQLGTGSFSSKLDSPQQVKMPDELGLVSISAGYHGSACALDVKGGVWCWGNNDLGQLGIGDTKTYNTPQKVFVPNVTFKQISVGSREACAVDTNSKIWCWGGNYFGQIGISNNTNTNAIYYGRLPNDGRSYYYNTPQQVKLGDEVNAKVLKVTVGGFTVCALLDSGQSLCWGLNNHGQLGAENNKSMFTNDVNDVPMEVTQTGTKFGAISEGEYTSCAVDTSNNVFCWGRNSYGQLGNATWNATNSSHLEQTIPGLVKISKRFISSVSVGQRSTCAVSVLHTLLCWGDNTYGQLGTGQVIGGGANIPQNVLLPDDGADKFIQISTGLSTNCALDENGQAWCWGSNDYGQAGGSEDKIYTYPHAIIQSIVPAKGNIVLTLESDIVTYGHSITATVTLENSIDTHNVAVTVDSQNTNMASINPHSCIIKGSNVGENTCTVIITAGNIKGNVVISALSENYVTSQESLKIISSLPPLLVDYLVVGGGGGGGGCYRIPVLDRNTSFGDIKAYGGYDGEVGNYPFGGNAGNNNRGGYTNLNICAGGGGGDGAVGTDSTSDAANPTAGNGGSGTKWGINGLTYGGGGGGGCRNYDRATKPGDGGSGGGGKGSQEGGDIHTGLANTGGGGGGFGLSSGGGGGQVVSGSMSINAGDSRYVTVSIGTKCFSSSVIDGNAGGSGVVIVSYISPDKQATGGTITSTGSGSNKRWFHTFKSNENYDRYFRVIDK